MLGTIARWLSAGLLTGTVALLPGRVPATPASVSSPPPTHAAPSRDDDSKPDSPACIRWRAEARYRAYGYDHLVHISNGCPKPATCIVSTNVNPESIEVTVRSGERETVVTYRGSPSREFEARVECTLR